MHNCYVAMQVVLWHAETLKQKAVLEEHSHLITDVRFGPSIPRIATSSFDKTVRVWDVENVSKPVRFVNGPSFAYHLFPCDSPVLHCTTLSSNI